MLLEENRDGEAAATERHECLGDFPNAMARVPEEAHGKFIVIFRHEDGADVGRA